MRTAELIGLARENGLSPVPGPLGPAWTARGLEAVLRHYGPLWCAIRRWPGGPGHVVVVRGITVGGGVEVMDPERGPVVWQMAQFNAMLDDDRHALLYVPLASEVRGGAREW